MQLAGFILGPAKEYERKVCAPLPSGKPAGVRRHQLSAAVSPCPLLGVKLLPDEHRVVSNCAVCGSISAVGIKEVCW